MKSINFLIIFFLFPIINSKGGGHGSGGHGSGGHGSSGHGSSSSGRSSSNRRVGSLIF